MKQKFVNSIHVEGYLHSFTLKQKVSGEQSKNPNTEFITGDLSVATTKECDNVITFHFSYVTEKTSKGNVNKTYGVLSDIINHKLKNVIDDGVDSAAKLSINSALASNDFYNKEGQLISTIRNEGGFVNVINEFTGDRDIDRCKFDLDFLIVSAKEVEEDSERGTKEHIELSGYGFDFKKAIFPISINTYSEKSMAFFRDNEISKKQPIFTQCMGIAKSLTLKRVKTETSMFGDEIVTETPIHKKEYELLNAKMPMIWDDESSILASEVAEKLAEREVYLAGVKQAQEDYQKSKETAAIPDYGF